MGTTLLCNDTPYILLPIGSILYLLGKLVLNHAIACSHIFFSEANHCYSFDDVTGQLAPFFTIARSWPQKRSILRTLKIHRKLTKIATTIIFSQW